MQVEVPRAIQRLASNARPRRQSNVTVTRSIHEVPHQRQRSAPRNTQAHVAHAHSSSADVVAPRPAPSVATPFPGATSVFFYLGLGIRNTDSVDDGVAATDGPSFAPGPPGEALLHGFHKAREQLGSSIAQLLFDGAAESMPSWDASHMAGVIMVLGLLRRLPDDEWLNEFWSVSLAKLHECATADLAMLSFGLSELQLQPPNPWRERMLAVTLARAEMEVPIAASAWGGAEAAPPVLEAWSPARPESVAAKLRSGVRSFVRSLELSVQRRRHSQHLALSQEAPGEQRGLHGAGPSVAWGLRASTSDRASSERQSQSKGASQAPWLPAAAGHNTRTATGDARSGPRSISSESISSGGSYGDVGLSVQTIISAYDMEDMYGGTRLQTSSSIVGLLLEPAQALWQGLRQATAAVSGAWRRARSGSELVTVVHNLMAAEVHMEPVWLGRFLQAMQPRLADLAADDLDCLLLTAAEANGPGSLGGAGGWLELSPSWQAALYARVDGINWGLQGRHLVGCLSSICSLGLRPQAGWVRRQMLALQFSLPMLPTSALVQLGTLLPDLSLYCINSTGAAAASQCPPTSIISLSLGDGLRWVDGWLDDYRSAVLERRDLMTATDLLSIIAGVAAATTMTAQTSPQGPPMSPLATPMKVPAGAAAAASQQLRSGVVSHQEWRKMMVEAVAERLPQSSLTGLCEAWQVLADADAKRALRQREQQSGVAAGMGRGGAEAGSGNAGSAAEHDFVSLRELIASRIAVQKAQLSTTDVAPVLSSLAVSGLPLPAPTLEALLAATSPLLPGLTSAELVTVVLSLVRLSYKPNLAWQAAFCAASRRRLGLMTPGQRCSLLVASAGLGLHLPDPWVKDFFAASERGGLADQLDGVQLANLLWAVSCVAGEPPASWLEQWEYASLPRLRELGPNMLAVVLKAMSTLNYRPSLAWQSVFFAALQRRLFVAGAARLKWPGAGSGSRAHAPSAPDTSKQGQEPCAPPDASPTTTTTTAADADGAAAAGPATPSTTAPTSISTHPAGASADWAFGGCTPTPTAAAAGGVSSNGVPASALDMMSTTVTTEALNSLVYSLAALDLAPPAAWLDELMDAVRCKLSLLSTLDMSVVLAYLVARSHRPSDDWWESFLEAHESRFDSLSASEMSSLLVMLNALKVSPSAHWLDAFCAATEAQLNSFQPSQLLQVLSCMHLFRHRPGQSWMAAYTATVEGQLPRFSVTELARVLMLLDHLNQRPSTGFMLRFYDTSRPGLAQLDTLELVNIAWAVVSCSTLTPDLRWTEALVEAARPRLASLQLPHLRLLVAALGHMQRGAPSPAAEDLIAFAREFLLV